MGLLELELSKVLKQVIAQGPKKTEELMYALVLLIERQQNAISHINWSDHSREHAKNAEEDLKKFFNHAKSLSIDSKENIVENTFPDKAP